MKKLFTIIAMVAFSMGAFAQSLPQVPNGSFEVWTNPTNPDYWSTLGNITGIGATFPYFAIQDTTSYVDGHTSLELITDTLTATYQNMVTPSVGGLGTLTLALTGQPVFSGIAYTKKPDSIYFSVKYTPHATNDSAEFIMSLNNAGVSLFGGTLGGKIPNTQGTWVNVATDLATYYQGSTLPDTLVLFFVSSTDTVSTDTITGATLLIDAVHFDASVNVANGIEQLLGNVNGINVFPNPTTDKINLAIQQDEVGSQIQLFDMEGREVYNAILSSATSSIDVHTFPAGVYSIRVNSIDKLTTYKGKITVTR